jgi:hypothetical protein
MTDKELKKLNKSELLELLTIQSAENERLKRQLEEVQQKLEDRTILIERSGSIAEAALRINEVFEAAQRAADQYLYNIEQSVGHRGGQS